MNRKMGEKQDLDKIDARLGLLKPMGVKEIARTGTIALPREQIK